MTAKRSGRLVAGVLAAVVAALVLPLAAVADEEPRDDVRRTGTCTGSSKVELDLGADDGAIRIELEIETRRRGAKWSVILLHERRTVFRGIVRTRGGGTLELRRTVPDWFGSDTVAARASGPRRETCRVSATL
jgi:hypothetical protein